MKKIRYILLGLLMAAGAVQGAIVVTGSGSGTAADAAFPAEFTPASSTDLADSSQPSFSSYTLTGLTTTEAGVLNDGAVGVGNSGIDFRAPVITTDAYTINFDTSVNTSGYTITGINSYAAWSTTGGGRANQGYTVTVTFMDDTTSEIVSGTHYANDATTGGTKTWTQVLMTDATGVIATGVKAITFDNFDDAGAGGSVQYREFDVIYSTPPPVVAVINVSTNSGDAPLEVVFDGSGSSTTNASISEYAWDFGDGNADSGAQVSHTYTADGVYTAWLTVTDSESNVASNSVEIVAGKYPYDIGTVATITFDQATDELTNTGLITDWTDATLKLSDGSDLSNVDFTVLGVTNWSTAQFVGAASTIWDGANLSGLNLTFTGNNAWRADSLIGTDFSGSTIGNGAAWNQFFLFSDLTDASFSGATLNITPYGGTINSFRGATLTGADFKDITWGIAASNGAAAFFDGGAGVINAVDKDLAADFSGADLSLITGTAKTNMIANLGGFDGDTPIGAKYDDGLLTASGWSKSELDAAGWQYILTLLPASLAVTFDGTDMVLGASGMGLGAVNSLQESASLVYTNWVTIASTTGVENVEWVIPATTEPAAFFRVISE